MLHSMRETIGMNKRAIGIWWRESPGMLVALIFYVITGAVLPYAGIYFSAQIITELAGAKNPVVLRNLVLLLLGIESLLGLNKLTGGADLGCVWLSLLWKGCCRQLPVLPEH